MAKLGNNICKICSGRSEFIVVNGKLPVPMPDCTSLVDACAPSWHDYIELMESYKLFESFGSPLIRKPLAKTSNLTESPQITDELVLKVITKTLNESLHRLTVPTTTSTLTALTSQAKTTPPPATTSFTATCTHCLTPGHARQFYGTISRLSSMAVILDSDTSDPQLMAADTDMLDKSRTRDTADCMVVISATGNYFLDDMEFP